VTVPAPSTPPAVQVLGAAVLVQGPAVVDLHSLVVAGVRETTRRDGITPSARLSSLVSALETAARVVRAGSAGPGTDVRHHPESAQWNPENVVDTREVAQMLDISERHARRLARTLGGRPSRAGVWSFDRRAVQAHLDAIGQESA
jgi:hypothetical protein